MTFVIIWPAIYPHSARNYLIFARGVKAWKMYARIFVGSYLIAIHSIHAATTKKIYGEIDVETCKKYQGTSWELHRHNIQ